MKQKLKTFTKGSILVYSLIILFVMLAIALSVSVVSINERKDAGTSGKSIQAFQTANSGSELFPPRSPSPCRGCNFGFYPFHFLSFYQTTLLGNGCDPLLTGVPAAVIVTLCFF